MATQESRPKPSGLLHLVARGGWGLQKVPQQHWHPEMLCEQGLDGHESRLYMEAVHLLLPPRGLHHQFEWVQHLWEPKYIDIYVSYAQIQN